MTWQKNIDYRGEKRSLERVKEDNEGSKRKIMCFVSYVKSK